jgi:hypothetical protein
VNGKRVLRWLPIAGIALHLVFWLTFGPLDSLLEARWLLAQDDPYAFYDRDISRGLAAVATLFWIYLPAILLTLTLGLVCRWKGIQEPKLWQALGPALGVFTITYVLFLWVSNEW